MRGAPWRVRRIALVVVLGIAVASVSCDYATDVELLEIAGSGAVVGLVFLDLDGSGTLSAADQPLATVDLALVNSGTTDVVLETTTDVDGLFALESVPVGSYDLQLDPSLLGDSLSVFGPTTLITIESGDTAQVEVGATFPTLSLEEALAAAPGSRVFTAGIALNPRVNFGDGQVHFRGATSYLRGLDVERGAINPGDSLRLLGRIVSDNGRPALRNVTYFVLQPLAQLVTPLEISTAAAATANGGALDAALARMRRAEITDTSTTPEGHFRFWADDGTDSVEFVIRDFLVPSVNTSAFRPDTVVRIREATGLLSPYDDGSGSIRWRFLPRAGSDIVLENRTVDIAVTAAFDAAQATQTDTVEVRVAVSNSGPLAANMVQVRDTIPTGSAFVSATATRGTYASGTGVWDIGTMPVGASDTLRIRLEITATAPATVTNIAQLLPLVTEIDTNGTNNAANVGLTIIP